VTGATLISPAEPLATQTERLATPGKSTKPGPRRTYSCPDCEHVLRVSGLGRHRVYFELKDEWSYDPVMNRVCPACGHGLPGKSPR
jgi:uncharacterized protein YlaI